MRVIIFERWLSGHRVRYVQYLIEYFESIQVRPIVILDEAAKSSESFRLNLAHMHGVCDFEFTIPNRSRFIPLPLVHWFALCAAITRHYPDRVVIPTADRLAQVCGLFWLFLWHPAVRHAEIHVTLLGLRFGHPLKNIREAGIRLVNLLTLAVARLAAIYTINERNVQDSSSCIRWLLCMGYVAEPVAIPVAPNRLAARTRAGLPRDGRLVGIVGGLDARKNVALCLEALKCEQWPQDTKLLLSGPMDPAIHACVESVKPALNLIVRARLLSEEELSTTLEALDLVLVLYSQHEGPSSIVIKAAGCGVPILGTAEGWIGTTVRNHNLGRVIVGGTADAVATEIGLMLEAHEPRSLTQEDREWLKEFMPLVFSARISGMAAAINILPK